MAIDDRRIIRLSAPRHVRTAVHAILTGHMAGHLAQQKIDLTDRVAARNALEIAGFGEPSIANLLDRSIQLAAQITDAQETANG